MVEVLNASCKLECIRHWDFLLLHASVEVIKYLFKNWLLLLKVFNESKLLIDLDILIKVDHRVLCETGLVTQLLEVLFESLVKDHIRCGSDLNSLNLWSGF